MPNPGRDLTFDERLAAETAFKGEPMNPGWSPSALAVYFGILAVTHGQDITQLAGERRRKAGPLDTEPALVSGERELETTGEV